MEANLPAFAETKETIEAKKLLSSVAHLETLRHKLAARLQFTDDTAKALSIRKSNRDAKRALASIERQIEANRAQLRQIAPQEARQIADMTPGVSHEQVATLLVALGDKKFENRDQLVAFVGLDVRLRQGGSWQRKPVLSKRGNGYLRKVRFQIGWSLMVNNEHYQALYQKMRERGKSYKTCIIALARKSLRACLRSIGRRRSLRPSPRDLTAGSGPCGRALCLRQQSCAHHDKVFKAKPSRGILLRENQFC